MSARTEQMLDYQIEQTTGAVADWRERVTGLQAELKTAEAELGEQQAHLDTLHGLRAMTAGKFTLVAPAAIQSDDDVMGLAIGPFRMAPADGAPVADLRLFAATMRAIYQQGMHQAELANQEVRRREQVSTLETTALPDDIVQQAKASTVVPPAQFVQDVMTCGIGACGLPIRYDEALSQWVHRDTGDALCWPSQLDGPFADPAPDDGTTTWKPPAYPDAPPYAADLLGKRVAVRTIAGKTITGVLTGADPWGVAVKVDDVINGAVMRDIRTEDIDRIEPDEPNASPFRSFAGPPAYPAEAAVPALPKRRPGEALTDAPAPREMDGTVARPSTLRRALDGIKRLGTDDTPASNEQDGDDRGHQPDASECTCVHTCADDPATACSLSGTWHVHPDNGLGIFGPCPEHPDAPGDL